MQRNIHISDAQFSELQAAFLLAYAFMYAGGGRLLDALGTRRGFASIMTWWSLACASQGLATSVPMLGTARFLLGMGEGGGFPAATKAVREQFPSEERATAMGLINAGTAVGAILAPPVVAVVILLTFLEVGVLLVRCPGFALDDLVARGIEASGRGRRRDDSSGADRGESSVAASCGAATRARIGRREISD